jgi:MFS family permease
MRPAAAQLEEQMSSVPQAAVPVAPPRSDTATVAGGWFVVALLMLAYVFSFMDRQVLSVLVGPVRKDLGISDTQMSLLLGFSFAIFYAICGIPLGRLADRHNRRGIIVAGILLWSFMTGLCGTARQYWQLFLWRIGVGVGEAALSPAAYSMIADYFPPQRRAVAISVYSMGIYIGSGVGFIAVALIVKWAAGYGVIDLPMFGVTQPWQLVFFVLGLSGILFTSVLFLIREPARTNKASDGDVPFSEVVAYLWKNRRTVLSHNVGFALISFVSYGTSAWLPTFFIRTHGWTAPQAGSVFGLMVTVFGSAGIVFGGWLADRWRAQGKTDAGMRVGIAAALSALLIGGLYLFMPNGMLAALGLIPAVFILAMPFGAAPAAIQEIMPNEMRGQASAVYLFIVNLIGLGLGPTAIALVTDKVFHDDNALRWSMLIVGSFACVSALAVLASGLGSYRETLARTRETFARA